MELGTIIGIIVGVFLIGGIAAIAYYQNKEDVNRIDRRREAYNAAITSGNKQAALEAGRKYYASMRENGRLTLYDEQAIANDLRAM